ncbi:MAG: guanylate kinase [Ruminococcus sp.]|nr:guanylate kinase [Ruminococcus sp.]
MERGKLVVYTGYSGVGKGTIMKRLRELDDSVKLSISCTTRQPREGETNGVEYYFVTKDEFENLIEQDGFLEYASYCDNYYGTPEKAVDEMLEKGYNVFLEIEVQGGMQVMKKRPDCISIFIAPPSFEELERRLRERGTESDESILKRLSAVEEESKYQQYYTHTVLNDKVERAAREILSIIHNK